MQHRPAPHLDSHRFPPEPWRLTERGFTADSVATSETLFALANGYLGIRASLDEGEPAGDPGTFVNGFYETWPISYPESAFGLPKLGQSIVVLPDATPLVLHVGGKPMRLTSGRTIVHERALDLREGILRRRVEWESPGGTRVRLRSERLVSFAHRHLAAFRIEVERLAGHEPLTLVSQFVHRHAGARPRAAGEEDDDPRRATNVAEALVAEASQAEGQRVVLSHRTRRTNLGMVCGVDHRFDPGSSITFRKKGGEENAIEYAWEDGVGSVMRLEKFAAYYTSTDRDDDLTAHVAADLDRAVSDGFEAIAGAQREHMHRFWQRADVRIDGDDQTQQAVRWNIFQLAQATLRADGLGIPAKGLTGRGYDGHYFWDVEVYVQPFLTFTFPELSRQLLRFRYGMLDAARAQARVIGESGALFPWRTINGDEASGNYATSTAQYHINGDVAYALRHYAGITGDSAVFADFGAELLVETARLWASLGFYGPDGRFHIHAATGPDEYTLLVDDNAFTNLIARENLRLACEAVRRLQSGSGRAYDELAARLALDPEEPDAWLRAADRMFIPYDEKRGIHPQDISFLDQEPWDFAGVPADDYPLLLHYHPLVLRRHQVVKQADVVLAMFLLGNQFTAEQRRANFSYYEPITTADSSLSHAIQSIVGAEVHEQSLAELHFYHALYMDLINWAGNAQDGVHIASAGGVWMALVYGFGGLRDYDGNLTFEPHLPEAWTSLSFTLRARGSALQVALSHEAIAFQLLEGMPIDVEVNGTRIAITREGRAVVPLAG